MHVPLKSFDLRRIRGHSSSYGDRAGPEALASNPLLPRMWPLGFPHYRFPLRPPECGPRHNLDSRHAPALSSRIPVPFLLRPAARTHLLPPESPAEAASSDVTFPITPLEVCKFRLSYFDPLSPNRYPTWQEKLIQQVASTL